MLNAKSCLPAIFILLAGCATQPAKVANTKPASDVQCVSDQLTGSRITHSVCTSQEQRDRQAADTEQVREEMQHPGAPCRPGESC